MQQGLVVGGLVLVPSMSAIYLALRHSPAFVLRTNWQSRTAMAIMPALFAFALTSETHLHSKMVLNAAQQQQQEKSTTKTMTLQETKNLSSLATHLDVSKNEAMVQHSINGHRYSFDNNKNETQRDLMTLYQKTLEQENHRNEKVNIVPGNQLGWHHELANYVTAHPLKTLGAVAIPSVAWILYGRSGQQHLPASIKVLHTRVLGQFTTLTLFLSIMGFRDYMQRHGTFITELEAFRREEEMQQIRQQVLERLDYEHFLKEGQEREFRAAQEEDRKARVLLRDQRKKPAQIVASSITSQQKDGLRTTMTTNTDPTVNPEPTLV